MERLEKEQHRLIALVEDALRAGHTEEEIVALVDESFADGEASRDDRLDRAA